MATQLYIKIGSDFVAYEGDPAQAQAEAKAMARSLKLCAEVVTPSKKADYERKLTIRTNVEAAGERAYRKAAARMKVVTTHAVNQAELKSLIAHAVKDLKAHGFAGYSLVKQAQDPSSRLTTGQLSWLITEAARASAKARSYAYWSKKLAA